MLVGRAPSRSPRSPWLRDAGLEPASLDNGACPVVPLVKAGDVEQAMINAFLGKPMILEFLPEWFEEGAGPGALKTFERLSEMDVKPAWTPLDAVSRSLYLMRRTGSTVEIRMFAREVVVQGVNFARQRVEVIPPQPPIVSMERAPLDGALEGRGIPTSAGELRFEVLDETSLRLALRRQPPDLSHVPLGRGASSLVRGLKDLVARSPLRWIGRGRKG